MRISKGMFALLAGFAMSGAAMADDAAQPASTTAEKKAPIQQILPNAYGKIEVRQDNLRAYNDNVQSHDLAMQEFLPKIGTTLFNDAVDTSFTWRFQHQNSTNQLTKYDFYNETQWNWVDGKFNDDSPYNFGPYAWTDFIGKPDNQSDFSYADIGFYGEVNYKFPITSGAIALMFYEQPLGEIVTSNDDQVPAYASQVDNQTNKGANQLGLTEDPKGNAQTPPHDPWLINYTGTSIKYIPDGLSKKLSVGVGIDVSNVWRPKYKEADVDGQDQLQQDGYKAEIMTMNRLIIGYKISDKVSLSEQLRAFNAGYDQSRIDTSHPDPTGLVADYHWENRLALSATLF